MPNKEKEKNKRSIKKNIVYTNLNLSAEITCPICGFEADIWTHEEETLCHICGYKFFQKEKIIH